jgi:hypothetical protein
LRLQQTRANIGIAFLFWSDWYRSHAFAVGAPALIDGQLAAVHSAAKLNRSFLQKAARPAKKHVGCFERGMRPHIVAVRSRQCIISREKQKPFFNA